MRPIAVLVCAAALAPGCRAAGPAAEVGEWFRDAAADTGLHFVHFNGASGEFYYPEMFGPGVGLLDIDNDFDLDVYLTQGQTLGGKTVKDVRDRLFRNDLTVNADGTRTLRFTDITDASGIDLRSYGMGVAAGDVDNDGFVDIYRTGFDDSVLLRNNGNGTFTDITGASGAGNGGAWAVSASLVDYDRDGWLDLYVGNYVDYRVDRDVNCLSVTGRPDYCPPQKFPPQRDRLYRNLGRGAGRDGLPAFEDVTSRALTGGADGPALGVSTADFDGDGWIDIYVANDNTPNQLWMNQRDGTFRDAAFPSGAAVSGAGAAEASMGVDAGDFDNDGDEDLFITNWLSQMNTLYVNGGGVFQDRRGPAGLGQPSLARTGFGTAWFDYDNDGWLDLLTANGSVAIVEAQAGDRDPFPYRMPNQLYRNLGTGRFEDVSARAGSIFSLSEVSRGAAFGDIDNDGDGDVVIGNDGGPLRLLVNGIGNRNHWVGLRVVDGARDAYGARLQITTPDGRTLWRRVRADGSYASANDPRVLTGMGSSSAPVKVRVQWPDGTIEEWSGVAVDRWSTLTKGQRTR